MPDPAGLPQAIICISQLLKFYKRLSAHMVNGSLCDLVFAR